ncbi:BNR repeat-like domain-containing protein [Parafilimonas terrae]|uniref:BNR repeat-like domain-containing protein n=2 Tax=Parafilimonas terrae TaxID=1465490 RepID=A0A1I5WVI7_9BACT|nr:BNR repeat-like domain-containing protein [Parafilimonas terrae]
MLLVFCMIIYAALPAQTMLADRVAYYPRIVQMQNGDLITSFDNGNTGAFYESKDSGKTWATVSNLKETTPPRNCCSELYVFPEKLNDTKAGTLFWATSVGTDQTPRTNCSIRIYKSEDHARTWQFYSTAVKGEIGLWEPEFIVDDKQNLLMFFSSEEYKAQGYNQIIAHRISTDGGLTWSDDIKDVAVNDNIKRPGMPTVTKLANGTYIMCYEVCGNNCDTYIRFSKDGNDWGNATGLGARVESTNGNHFSHAPTITWFDDGTKNGVLLLIGQVLNKNADNTIADNNGSVYMVNRNNGEGLWTEVRAPVASPSDGKNPCENYSSQLLLLNNQKVLELALKKVNGACRLFYNTNNLNDSATATFIK